MLAKLVNRMPNVVSQHITKLYFRALASSQVEPHSYQQTLSEPTMDVQILPALQDNYMYLIVDKATNEAAVVDPVEPGVVLAAVEQAGVNLTTVLTTHHHWDHAGGNKDLVKLRPSLKVYGGDARIGALTDAVTHDAELRVGALRVRCLATPCHTTGHVCYYVTPNESDEGAVFSGDTLFLGGCGRFFEGTAEQMLAALCGVLSALPAATRVYCGHEYALQNLRYAAQVEPANEVLKAKYKEIEARREAKKPSVPSTIGEERQYNPFMRVREPAVLEYARAADPVAAMRTLRAEKDNFK